MSAILFFSVEKKFGQAWSTVAFAAGAITSLIAGYIGMTVAVYANGRVALQTQKSLREGFIAAFRAGSVMGFCLTSLGLLVLLVILVTYNMWYKDIDTDMDQFISMYEAIASYGLGGSSIALFGRVGGGIYTKAADVGADLVGKVEAHLDEDSPKNPGTIADNVGDNVGDVAGMGADLFGSFAESSSATLVVASTIEAFQKKEGRGAMYFAVAITAFGIMVCLVSSFVATNCNGLEMEDRNYKKALQKTKSNFVKIILMLY
jgi:inorganic pyrophosphatase